MCHLQWFMFIFFVPLQRDLSEQLRAQAWFRRNPAAVEGALPQHVG